MMSPIIAVYFSSVVLDLEIVLHSKSLCGGSLKLNASAVSGNTRLERLS
jgi:hypothetical protein